MFFDVIIVGAGLIGNSLALALAHLPLRIGIIEARPELIAAPLKQNTVDQGDLAFLTAGGPISLNPVSQQLLASFDVWKSLAAESQIITQIHISEKGRFGKLRLEAPNRNPLGYVIPRQSLIHALQSQLAHTLTSDATKAQFHLITGAKIQSIQRIEDMWELSLSSHPQKSLKAHLLIACDGHHSQVRQALAISSQTYPLEEDALIAWVKQNHTLHTTRSTAYERFTSQGTLALLPYLNHTMGLVWAAPSQEIDLLLSLEENDFLDRVHALLGPGFGKLSLLSKRTRHPIYRTPPQPMTQPNVIALGDAAYRFHPVAAQGLNASFQDIITLVDVMSTACETRQTIDYEQNKEIALKIDLQCYFDIALPRQKKHWHTTETIRRLFKPSLAPIAFARSIGLGLTDCFPPLKKMLTRHFSGEML